MPLLTCPCAFRLRRLAQNAGREISVRHFPCKFPHKIPLLTLSMCISIAQARTKRWPREARPAFSCKFPDKMALLTWAMCMSIAQARTKRWPWDKRPAFSFYISAQNAKWLFWHVHVHFDCAGSHKTLAAGKASGIFPVNFRTKCNMSMCISTAQARTKRWPWEKRPAFSL